MPTLTRREEQILALISRGENSNEIARILGVSLHTVRKHRRNVASKLGLHTNAQLVSYCVLNLPAQNVAWNKAPRADGLTEREKKILHLLALGRTSKQIAKQLLISPRTVSKHIENIRFKTGETTLANLIRISSQLSERPDHKIDH